MNLMRFLKNISSPSISDAMDVIGLNGGCIGITPVITGFRIAGPAYTVRFDLCAEGEMAPAADYIDEVPPGSVIVIDNAGRNNCTVWGDILTKVALHKGIEGTVIDGMARDISALRELGYPLFSKGTFMKSGKNRVRMTAEQVPVFLSGIPVFPGDIICGDDSGIIVVPQGHVAEIIPIIQEIEEMEKNVLLLLQDGASLKEARKKCGYNRFARRVA